MPEMNTEWRNWVADNLTKGIPEQEVAQILLAHEFEEFIAYKTVIEMASQIQLKESDSSMTLEPVSLFQRTMPCNGLDKPWSIIMQLESPIIRAYANVLTPEECDRLIELSSSKLAPSTTVDNNTGEALPHEHRTSRGTFFQRQENDFIKSIDERLAKIMNLPLEHGEGLQILNYGIGGEYKPHHDYFPPVNPGSEVHIKRGGQRVATLVMYLNDVQEGGETIFPEVGVKVTPFKGGAVYFSYFHEGKVDPRCLHGGSPVIQGEKWIATKWVRESLYS